MHFSCEYFRIAKPEDVQYFQFDSEGNMFIFEPGAGCTGNVRKVSPGEELFNENCTQENLTQIYDLVPPSNVNVKSEPVVQICNDVPISAPTQARKKGPKR